MPERRLPMMSEAEIRLALMNWTAAHQAMLAMGDKDGARLAEGYVGALEMVLRGVS